MAAAAAAKSGRAFNPRSGAARGKSGGAKIGNAPKPPKPLRAPKAPPPPPPPRAAAPALAAAAGLKANRFFLDFPLPFLPYIPLSYAPAP